jgi:phosphoglycolate phosphatase
VRTIFSTVEIAGHSRVAPSNMDSCVTMHIQRALAKMTAIYFDLDGTLTDPKLGMTRSIQYALSKLDLAVPPADELTWCIGPPLLPSFKTLLNRDDLAHKALSLYRERYADIGLFENVIYPGIENVLSELAQSGHRLFVATGKPTVYAERIIGHFEMTAYFEHVFGSELDGQRTDKTELLSYALRTARVDPSQARMIGDRSHDMIAARNNGMTAVGVLYGYGSKEELVDAGAHQVCATPQGLLDHVS